MTISLDRSTQTATISKRADAAWQDYLDARDRNYLEWHKISFNNGWLRIDMGNIGINHERILIIADANRAVGEDVSLDGLLSVRSHQADIKKSRTIHPSFS
ncbi:hypothetical protein [Chamaesiphon sp.]|uniref:hypothetical protein n=1 Tax=Chamaesiphon sp. TaxID=2814140 RepID=UPI003593A731